MYAWGGSTSGWRKPGSYGFDSARKPYLDKLAAAASAKGPRTYARRNEPDMKLVDPRGKVITSESKNQLVIAVDVTGSMAEWPGEIFDRLPLLYQTLSQYRDDLEVCFAAIGDANCDSWPLQVNDFGKDLDLEERLKALGCEGGGGGQISETYELFAYFMQEKCKTPNATSPFLLIFGDEKFYPNVNPGQVEHYIGDKLQAPVEANQVWKGLMQRFNLFFLHKPYGDGREAATTKEVGDYWADTIGEQRVIELPNKERAVDIAMGLVAKHWGQYGDFTKNLSARQDDEDANSVYGSLRFIDGDPSAKSVVKGVTKTRRTMPLDKMGD